MVDIIVLMLDIVDYAKVVENICVDIIQGIP